MRVVATVALGRRRRLRSRLHRERLLGDAPAVPSAGVWAPPYRPLTLGLVLTVTLVALESLSVATIAPEIKAEFGDIGLYGWVFSGFFIGSLVGTVLAGQVTDRCGAAAAYGGGLVVFALGLVAAGLAPTMLALVVARVAQGLGAGAIPAVAYASVALVYPPELRPRMLAVTSSAWVLPGLLGPVIAGAVASSSTWRLVFLALVPLVPLAARLTVPALREATSAERPSASTDPQDRRVATTVGTGVVVAVAITALLAGLNAPNPLSAALLVAGGAAVGVPAFLRVVPAGTVVAAPGLPAAVLVRGLLTFAFFGAHAFVPLALRDVRGTSVAVAGVAVTSASVCWTAAAWVQQRLVHSVGARRLVRLGLMTLVAGVGGAALLLWDAMPVGGTIVLWAAAGFGVGLAHGPISVTVMSEARPDRRGEATAAMQLSDVVGVALGTGLGGTIVAVADSAGWPRETGLALAFALAGAVGAVGILVARRLPGPVERSFGTN